MARILLVDDDPLLLDSLSAMLALKLPGTEIDACDSGPAGLERLAQIDYDAVISDIKMPHMDGLTFMREILARRPDTPVLLITGHGDRDLGVQALNAGAYAFIPKPIDREYFVASLKRAVHVKALSRQVAEQTRRLRQYAKNLEGTVEERTAALRESDDRFRLMAETVPDIIYTNRPDGECDYTNSRFYDYTGLPFGSALGSGWIAALHPDDRARVQAQWSESVRTGRPFESDYRLRGADGTYRWFMGRARALSDVKGRISKWLGCCADVHELKSVQEKLQESQDRLNLALRAARMVAWDWDPRSDEVAQSDNAAEIFGLRAGQRIRTWEEARPHVHPDDLLRHQKIIAKAMAGGATYKSQLRMIRPDNGRILWLEDHGRVQVDGDGRPRRVSGVLQDITERKLAEEALNQSEERLRAIVEHASVGIAQTNLAGRFVFVNDRYCDLVGISRDRLLERTTDEVTHPDDRPAYQTYSAAAMATSSGFMVELRYVRPDGSCIWVANSVSVVRDGSRLPQYLVTISQDISERKRAETAALESEQRFRVLADTVPAMIWMADTDRQYCFFNQSWLKFRGRIMEQELRSGWTEGVHHDDLDKTVRAYAAAFDARREFEMEYRLRRFDGEYRWVFDKGVPRFTPDGAFAGYIGSCIDITDRKDLRPEVET